MMHILRKLNPKGLRALARDEGGTSVIELALIAPMLATVTMGIIDLSTGFSRRMEITEAVNRTVEKIAARNFEIPSNSSGPDFTFIKEDAAEAAGVPASAVTVTRWLECNGAEQPHFDGTCPADDSRAECQVSNPSPDLGCAPVMARYIEVRVDTTFKPAFATVFARRSDGTFPVSAEAAVRIQ
jgi:Flp pilus assembly pilin Flp